MTDKKILLLALLFLAGCASDPMEESGGKEAPAAAMRKIVNAPANAARGELLIYFDGDAVGDVEQTAVAAAITRTAVTRSGIAPVDDIFTQLGVTSLRRVFPCNPVAEERTRAAGLHKWYIVTFGEEVDLDAAARRLAAVSEVSFVQFNTKLQLASDNRACPYRGGSAATRAAAGGFNDPGYKDQWHYSNNGDRIFAETTRAGADINVEEAWKLAAGDPSLTVAIVDQGIKYSHPDLAANMWINKAEQSGTTGRDDDGNGYADDVYGYNFALGTSRLTWDVEAYDDKGKNVGDSGHGTHVAGTVAAVSNNGVGVSGIAGGTGRNDGVKLMSCQIFSGGNGGTISTSVRAIKYAADNGASIIQCSWGYPTQSPFTSDSYYERNYAAEKEAIDYFVSKKNNDVLDGGLAIFAAGNDATNFASYPGGYRSYVSVTSFGPDYLPAYYTNYGPGCNVAAPGGDASISPAGTSAAQVLSTLPSELPAELGTDGADYGYMQGTSMACPHVSGVAALGLSYALAKGRHYTVDEFKSMLLTAVNDIDSYIIGGTKNGMVLRNYRKNMGTGSIDAYQLLMQIEGTPCLPAKVGVQQVLSLDKFFGQASANLTYKSAEMSQADMDKLGITAAPAFSYGKLQIKCTKPGVAKIKIKAMAGSSSANGEMSGMEITKEFAIIARAVQAGNGGWL
ncbi:MAG: peptidase S8 [Alistipes sp. 58_9_plus]|nr:MAG: peptidase S8 [Alistipes sp. 58_9_plus]